MKKPVLILLFPMLLYSAMALAATGSVDEAGVTEPLPLRTNATLTLASVLESAFARYPQQQALQAGSVGVEARVKQATGLLPTAPAISLRHQNDAVGSTRNLSEWEAGLELPIWLPGQRAAREQVASETQSGWQASRVGLKLGLAGMVREALWNIAMSHTAVAQAQQRLQTAEALKKDVEARQSAGELAKTDTLQAQNEVLQAQSGLLRAQVELAHAEHRYRSLTGLNEIPQHVEEQPSTLTAIDERHPLLAEANARITLAQGERDLARVEKRDNPWVTVSARRERGAFDNAFNNSVGLALRIPLDTPARSAPVIASAEMALAQAVAQREQQLLDLQAAHHEATHNLETTRAELQIIEEQNRLAQENLRLAKKAFELGEADLVNLLRVRAIAQEAERLLASRRTQLQWDIARYNQSVGVLP